MTTIKAEKCLISERFSIQKSDCISSSHQSFQISLISEVKSRLQDDRYTLNKSNCPCGNSKKDVIISEVDRYGLPLNSILCMNCGTVRIDPYLDTASLNDFYTNLYQEMYGRASDLESYFERQKSYGMKVLSTVQNSLEAASWVCEVGCGAGGALKVFQTQKFNVAGCDYSHELIESGKQRGVARLFYGGLDELKNNVGDVQFDLMFLHHVFEHLSDPLSFLIDCRNILRDNGKIIIIIPNIAGIDSSKFPGGDLLPYLHIAHKYNFSFNCLQSLAKQSGYFISILHPDSRLKTPCSDSSELWIEMTQMPDSDFSETHIASDLSSSFEIGEKMLKYLMRTEKFYSLGLCKAQISRKLEKINNHISPRRMLGKIKRLLA